MGNLLKIIDVLKGNVTSCYKPKILKNDIYAREIFRITQECKYRVWRKRITNFLDSWYGRTLTYILCINTD